MEAFILCTTIQGNHCRCSALPHIPFVFSHETAFHLQMQNILIDFWLLAAFRGLRKKTSILAVVTDVEDPPPPPCLRLASCSSWKANPHTHSFHYFIFTNQGEEYPLLLICLWQLFHLLCFPSPFLDFWCCLPCLLCGCAYATSLPHSTAGTRKA